MTGPKVDKILGKGSIALISDEVLLALSIHRVNDVEGCIVMKSYEARDCVDVHMNISEREKLDLLRQLDESHDQFYLTMPMCTRSTEDSWTAAARLLETLAKAARKKAARAKAKQS